MKIVKSQLSVSSLRFLENYSITISAFTISVTTLPALCTLSEYLMYNIMERDGWKSDATLKKNIVGKWTIIKRNLQMSRTTILKIYATKYDTKKKNPSKYWGFHMRKMGLEQKSHFKNPHRKELSGHWLEVCKRSVNIYAGLPKPFSKRQNKEDGAIS